MADVAAMWDSACAVRCRPAIDSQWWRGVSDRSVRSRTLALRYMLGDFPGQLWNVGPVSIAASDIEKIKRMPRLVGALVLSMILIEASFERLGREERTCSMTGAQGVIMIPS